MSPDPWQRLAPVVTQGDRIASLEALRDRVAADLDECGSARDTAQLGRLLADVLDAIHRARQAVPPLGGTPLDELARRRAGRGSEDSGSAAGDR